VVVSEDPACPGEHAFEQFPGGSGVPEVVEPSCEDIRGVEGCDVIFAEDPAAASRRQAAPSA